VEMGILQGQTRGEGGEKTRGDAGRRLEGIRERRERHTGRMGERRELLTGEGEGEKKTKRRRSGMMQEIRNTCGMGRTVRYGTVLSLTGTYCVVRYGTGRAGVFLMLLSGWRELSVIIIFLYYYPLVLFISLSSFFLLPL
jgi:hypothetical protein